MLDAKNRWQAYRAGQIARFRGLVGPILYKRDRSEFGILMVGNSVLEYF